jgi:putative hydrolase of the HAD superfamily
MGWRAVLFDLFDTLVRLHRDRLPALQIHGRTVHSTAGQLHGALAPWAPHVSLEALYDALVESWQAAERRRAGDHREVPAPERFADLLRRLGLDPWPPAVLHALLEAHREGLSRAAELPPHHRALLEALAPHYRLGVVSNFDYTPTALAILDGAGVRGYFSAVVVSDAVGWRKPAPAIFRVALERLGVAPHEALFVGDRPEIDVAGAQGVGLSVAWLNPAGAPLPPGLAPPAFELRDLEDLRGILLPASRI